MKITVEFAGLARVLTRQSQIHLDVSEGMTFRDILFRLAEMFPQLAGDVIDPTLGTLRSSNMLNLNGKRMIQPSEMDASPQEGDRLILMSILAGG